MLTNLAGLIKRRLPFVEMIFVGCTKLKGAENVSEVLHVQLYVVGNIVTTKQQGVVVSLLFYFKTLAGLWISQLKASIFAHRIENTLIPIVRA